MPVWTGESRERRGAESIRERLVVRAANFFILGVDKLYCLQYNRDRDKEREAERQGGTS